MRRRWWGWLGLGTLLLLASTRLLHEIPYTAPGDAAIRFIRGRTHTPLESFHTAVENPPEVPVLKSLGLPDAEIYPLRVLLQTPDDTVLIYPPATDPAEIASRWTTAMEAAGFKRGPDHSRKRRGSTWWEGPDGPVLLVSGLTVEGPYIDFSRTPERSTHWSTLGNETAPPELAPLLASLDEDD